jgi:hypothetical protein
MSVHPIVEFTEPFRAEAEADMRRLGFNPASPEAWRRYALLLVRDRCLLFGVFSPENDEIVEINKASYERLMRVAVRAVHVIAKLNEIEDRYLAIEPRHQKDALLAAIEAFDWLEEGLDPFGISKAGGLPTPLRLVLADLINILEGRLGRLVSPDDQVVAGAREVSDSSKDRVRLTVHAYAASTVHRLIASGSVASNEEAYRVVAQALDEVGFRPPGKRKRGPVSRETVRSWYESAMTERCRFAEEYKQALKAAEAPPAQLVAAFKSAVRDLMFTRGKQPFNGNDGSSRADRRPGRRR